VAVSGRAKQGAKTTSERLPQGRFQSGRRVLRLAPLEAHESAAGRAGWNHGHKSVPTGGGFFVFALKARAGKELRLAW
jgi:hypothetical protein